MLSLWNLFQGKKTYLLSAICIAIVLLHALEELVQDQPVDWVQVGHQVMACLITMALRHDIAQPANQDPEPAKPKRPLDRQLELFP
jgi:hypothetical protein